MRAINSKNCSGWEGLIIATLSAWCDWKQEDILAAVESWVQDGGLESVNDRLERNAGYAMLVQRSGVADHFWRHVSENEVLRRAFKLAAVARYEASNPGSGAPDEDKIAKGLSIVKELANDLMADRVGRIVLTHPSFAARWKAIQLQRRNQQIVNKIHSL